MISVASESLCSPTFWGPQGIYIALGGRAAGQEVNGTIIGPVTGQRCNLDLAAEDSAEVGIF